MDDTKKRVLLVTQELNPYIIETAMAEFARQQAGHLQKNDFEIRILMPRFGSINERRHRLHEVVRLSGINIIIDDDDYPLVIKVASLPGARMQVYFLDNEDFFKRHEMFHDKEGKLFEDNVDRMVFFCRGVIETVKKFGWAPDVVHCHGWMTSLIPLFLKTAYKKEPIFATSKLVMSMYENEFKGKLPSQFLHKTLINRVEEADLEPYGTGTNDELNMGAMHYADAVIAGAPKLSKKTTDFFKALGDKPHLPFQEAEGMYDAYVAFYETLIEE